VTVLANPDAGSVASAQVQSRKRGTRTGVPAQRVHWLDGVRALAAMYVVIHHFWLASYPVADVNTGPWFLGWLLYGQMAVAVFIVVSGYSLSLKPARSGFVLPPSGGVRTFLARRAWRILPPYWAALLFSALIVGLWIGRSTGQHVTAKAVVVHALLLQDVVSSSTINGTFWSIAVEWQIYLVFPLLLVLARWKGPRIAALIGAAVVVLAHVLAGLVPAFSPIDNVTPQFLALFAFGMAAAAVGTSSQRTAKIAAVCGAVILAGFLAVCVFLGSAYVVGHYFEFDLAVGLAVALIFAAITAGGLGRVRRALGCRTLVVLGAFSYSIYLIHTPLLGIVYYSVARPLHFRAGEAFAVLLLIALPVILLVSYAFYRVFERPFIEHRSSLIRSRAPKTRHRRVARHAAAPPARARTSIARFPDARAVTALEPQS
jgi:peptidoglycan/LPS O-acetylase OafA/YrhL